MPPTVILDLMAEINPVAPAATSKENAMSVPVITRADRPYNGVFTKQLVEMILALDPHAVIEAQLRLCHGRTLQVQNRRALVNALAAIARPPAVEVVDPVVLAKRQANELAKRLSGWTPKAPKRIARAAQLGYDLTNVAVLLEVVDTKVTQLVPQS